MRYAVFLRLMRLHQPVGVWLLFWPCAWAIALHAGGRAAVELLALFLAGAVLMRGAGCIVNDLWDRDIDAQVERTRRRPLASGEISAMQACALLAVLLAVSGGIAWALGREVMAWAAASLPLVALYPLMKRITWWPQLFLGLTFNWGALLGAVAAAGEVTAAAGWLYAGGVFWTLGYDTIYAHQDKADDARIGVKSTALHFGGATKGWLCLFYAMALLCWAMAGRAAEVNALYYSALMLVYLHFIGQIRHVRLQEPASCRRAFVSNGWAGALVFAGAVLGKSI